MTIFVVDLHTLMESNKNINNCHFFFPDPAQACLMLISEELRLKGYKCLNNNQAKKHLMQMRSSSNKHSLICMQDAGRSYNNGSFASYLVFMSLG